MGRVVKQSLKRSSCRPITSRGSSAGLRRFKASGEKSQRSARWSRSSFDDPSELSDIGPEQCEVVWLLHIEDDAVAGVAEQPADRSAGCSSRRSVDSTATYETACAQSGLDVLGLDRLHVPPVLGIAR